METGEKNLLPTISEENIIKKVHSKLKKATSVVL